MYKHNKKKLIPGKLYSLKLQNCTFRNENYVERLSDSGIGVFHAVMLRVASEKIIESITKKTSPIESIMVIYLGSVKCDLCNKVPTKQLRCYCHHNFLYKNKNISIYDFRKVATFPNGFQTHYLANQLSIL